VPAKANPWKYNTKKLHHMILEYQKGEIQVRNIAITSTPFDAFGSSCSSDGSAGVVDERGL
jgi:hypothetical protein